MFPSLTLSSNIPSTSSCTPKYSAIDDNYFLLPSWLSDQNSDSSDYLKVVRTLGPTTFNTNTKNFSSVNFLRRHTTSQKITLSNRGYSRGFF